MKKAFVISLMLAAANTSANNIPIIVEDTCFYSKEVQGVEECIVKFDDGSTQEYWKVEGKIYWVNPFNVPAVRKNNKINPK
jgi:hypothetical protein